MPSTRPFLRDSLALSAYSSCGLTVDFGRQRLTSDDLHGLIELACQKGVLGTAKAQREGALVNRSEGQNALHTALRDPRVNAPYHKKVSRALKHICVFADSVRSGRFKGCRGDVITDVVNVGIGGSEVGVRTVYHALRTPNPTLRLHFLAAVDGVSFDRIVEELNPFKTLVIVSSKSFKTRETIANAEAIDQWFLEFGITGSDRNHHIVAVSANENAAAEMKLPQENLFPMWDWVGGLFSFWSSAGLADAIALGADAFRQLLAGGHEMDLHVENSPPATNMALLMALISHWNATQLHIASHCFVPYDERLRFMVKWLQQLEMQSLGKNACLDRQSMNGQIGQRIWGGHGDESQHSFYQWLREGTDKSSIDLLWCNRYGHRHTELHRVLIANAKAQADALVTRENSEYFNSVTTIAIDELTPACLGSLMSL